MNNLYEEYELKEIAKQLLSIEESGQQHTLSPTQRSHYKRLLTKYNKLQQRMERY